MCNQIIHPQKEDVCRHCLSHVSCVLSKAMIIATGFVLFSLLPISLTDVAILHEGSGDTSSVFSSESPPTSTPPMFEEVDEQGSGESMKKFVYLVNVQYNADGSLKNSITTSDPNKKTTQITNSFRGDGKMHAAIMMPEEYF